MVRSGCSHSGHKVNEWINELSWVFVCSSWHQGKLKVTLGMDMVKYGNDLLGSETLKYAMSQE